MANQFNQLHIDFKNNKVSIKPRPSNEFIEYKLNKKEYNELLKSYDELIELDKLKLCSELKLDKMLDEIIDKYERKVK